ncbi:hypothetical protein MWH25_10740 [Natroniella acetigena]|uniref:hypothetical protein n=1 Tax=Natroniella acetigena TaxID=52004 RepID=UPI00200B7DE8|nr:hypothetical protein [Natroniella acetigena]MCK8828209.1 hypothetical protein [Natroniella acetigena]
MKRIICLVSVLLMLVFIVVGCAENPRGTFGPAWDVGVQIPLVEYEREDIRDLLDDEDVEFGENDEVVEYHYSDLLEEIELGDELDEVEDELPQVSENINMDPIEIAVDDASFEETLENIPAGVSGSSGDIDQIDKIELNFVQEFDDINFTSIGLADQGLNITLTNPKGSGITVEEFKLIFSDEDGEIASLDVVGEDADYEGNLEPDDDAKAELINVELPAEVDVDIEIATEGTDTGDLVLDFSFDEIEANKATDLDVDNADIEEDFTRDVGVDTSDLQGSKSIKFAAGQFKIEIEDESDFDFEFESFELGNLSQTGNGIIDLDRKILDISSLEEDGINFNLKVSAESPITFDFTKDFMVTGGFEGAEIEEIKIESLDDFSENEEFELDDLEGTINEDGDTIDDLPEELADIEFSDELKMELIFAGLTELGLEIELEDFVFEAYNEGEKLIEKIDLSGTYKENISLTKDDNNLLDLLTNEDTDYIEYGGDYRIRQIEDQYAKLTPDSQIDIEFNAEVPIEVTLTDDIEHRLEPEELDDNICEDDVDLIKDGIKNARLKAEIDNQLPVEVEIEIYVARISDYADDEDLEDELYRDENKLATGFDLAARTYDADFETPFEVDDADRFTEDNLYVGGKIILPVDEEEEEMKFELRSNDYIEINNLYAVLTAKVNQ